MEETLHILLIEDSDADAFLLQESLALIEHPPHVMHADTLEAALKHLQQSPIDAILLDLALPDSEGLSTLERMNEAADYLPIIVLTGFEDEAVAIKAVRKGAQDYLIKGQTGARQLIQTILRAIERKRLDRALAQSAQRNLLLAEISADVAAQTEVEGLLGTVVAAARKLTSARASCAGAGYEKGRFRFHKASGEECITSELSNDAGQNEDACQDPAGRQVSIRLSDEELRSHARLCGLTGLSSVRGNAIGARLVDTHGKATGSIIVSGKERGEGFTDEDEVLLRQLAFIASLALRHIESRKAAEAASIAKTQFLANMSHELRTPMNAILGMTDLALAEELPPKVHEYLQTARDSADVLLDILNEILDLSRIEAGRLELESTAFSLRRAVEQVVKTLRIRASEKGLALIYYLPPEVPHLLIGDPLRFRQILINLVDNAIKFTHEGKIAVKAEVLKITAEKALLEFSVSDTGIGIRPEDQARIFSPFTQADASTTRNYGGTGLGLTISRKLVELMNGQLRVESIPDHGATFYFTVNLRLPDATAAEVSQSGQSARPLARRRALRILLAEDTPTSQRVVEYLMTKRGHSVEIARNGREAVKMIEQRNYDTILMDVQMPVMDGLQATAAIRSMTDPAKARLPIIALTAHALKEDAERCVAAGMDAYVSKPVQIDELVELVELLGPAQSVGPDGDSEFESNELEPHLRAKVPALQGTAEKQLPAFDMADALKKCFDRHDFFVAMARSFSDEADACLLAIRDAQLANNFETVRDAAHRLKNTVVYLGARPTADAIISLENAAKSEDLEALDQSLQNLQLQVEILKQALADHSRPDEEAL